MRKLLLLLLVLVVAGVALAWYLDWFQVGITRQAETGKIEGKLEVDQNKIKADAARAREKFGGRSPAAQETAQKP